MDIGEKTGKIIELPQLDEEEVPIPVQIPEKVEEPIPVENWPVSVPVEE